MENEKYAVVKTAFHGGGTIGKYATLQQAEEACKANKHKGCRCGCCGVVAITEEAREKMSHAGYAIFCLYDELPAFNADQMYGKLVR